MDKTVYIKKPYSADTASMPVPILAHSNEVVLPVEICRELYPYLVNVSKTIPYGLRRRLRDIFEKNQIRI